MTDAQIAREILSSLANRDAQSSSCPSEIARALLPKHGDAWRTLMPRVREVAADLARQERVVITRGGARLGPDDLGGGPIRLRRGNRFQSG